MAAIVKTIKYVRSPFGQILKWLFIGFNLLMLCWLLTYCSDIAPMLSNGSGAEQAGAAIGSTIGVGLILVLWGLGTVILGIPMLLTKGQRVEIEETSKKDKVEEKKTVWEQILRFKLTIILISTILILGYCSYHASENLVKNPAVPSSSVPSQSPINTGGISPTVQVSPTINQPIKDEWVISRDTSKMDDSEGISLALFANDTAQAWLGKIHPSITLRCQEKKTDFIFDAETDFTPVYGEYNEAQIRLRVDNDKAQTQNWSESTDGKAVFASNPISLLKRLKDAKVLKIQFNPFNANPATAEFDLDGLKSHLEELAKTCGWQLP